MPPRFHPTLVNGPFGDPALYVDFLFERRALLFDAGTLERLPPRKILRIGHAFVSHTHMDHFIGLDRVVRTCLHQDKTLRLYGPPPLIDQVEHKLAAYSWNLVRDYPSDFTVIVTELGPDGRAQTAGFRSRAAWDREGDATVPVVDGVVLDEDAFRVRAAILDHMIPCLAFALEEKAHVNVWRTRLEELELPAGPWLAELKRAAIQRTPDDVRFRVWWREGAMTRERYLPLGTLKERLLSVTPGQKIGYVVDAVYHEENARHIVDLVRDADLLFIETAFLEEDAAAAARKYHLTARQAGLLARAAGVKRLIPFHFSPRYLGQEERLRREVREAFTS